MITKKELAGYIDYTLLKPTATFSDIDKLCEDAKKYGFFSVCVNSCYVDYAAKKLSQSDVKVITTVGFPLGAMSTEAKVFEAVKAIKDGAAEIDMVINLGYLKSGDFFEATRDIKEVVRGVKEIDKEAKVKVILEMGYLNINEKVSACKLARDGGADFVKTSTGFGAGNATVEDVKMMKKLVGKDMGIKASGGIKDYNTAVAMIEAGATRIGASSGIAILKGAN